MNGGVAIELVGDRAAFHPGDRVRGRVVWPTTAAAAPAQIRLQAEGAVYLNLSPKSVGLFEAFYSSLKPISVLNKSLNLLPAPSTSTTQVEYPFEFVLDDSDDGQRLISSYKGKLIAVQYALSVYTGRRFLPSTPKATREFVVAAYGPPSECRPARSPFRSHGYCQSQGENEAQIDLEIDLEGAIDNTLCSIEAEALSGEVVITRSTKQIRAITLTLNRIETCEYSEGALSDKSEVHTMEVAVGNVARNLPIPIQMPWPRLKTCPSITHDEFAIAFEVELRVHFVTGQYMVERIPIRLY